MTSHSRFLVIAHLLSVLAITLLISWIVEPQPFKGIIGFIFLILGYILSIAHMVKQEEKTFLFHENKKIHFFNWCAYIVALMSVAVAVAVILH